MKRFEGKVGIVTGAASGIGKSVMIRLASEGAKVVGADLNEAKASDEAPHITGASYIIDGGRCAG